MYYLASDPADIIYDLLVTYGGVDASYIALTDWQTESATYLGTVNTFIITEPTGVDKLIEEILEQTGSALWWDDVNQQVRWQVLRSIPATADRFNEDQVLLDFSLSASSLTSASLRIIVYYGQVNPTLKVDETHNYSSTEVVFD